MTGFYITITTATCKYIYVSFKMKDHWKMQPSVYWEKIYIVWIKNDKQKL